MIDWKQKDKTEYAVGMPRDTIAIAIDANS